MVEPEQIESLTRLLRAIAPQANDPEGLAQLIDLRDRFNGVISEQARALNDQGYSWAAISKPLGINRSAAHQRYGKR